MCEPYYYGNNNAEDPEGHCHFVLGNLSEQQVDKERETCDT
jgi:hypothetical protein